uniref:Peptidase S1 domain-containing protein n=1 Tax=Anopheles coluzzii TaxID=1518534 RepID=A0A8W7P5L9_ANOCL
LFGGFDDLHEQKCFERNGTTICAYPTQSRSIGRVVAHPRFSKNTINDNIALIELQSPADTTQPHVKPICLPVTPTLYTNQTENLSVLSLRLALRTIIDQEVIHLDSEFCTKVLSNTSFAIDNEDKSICVIVPEEDVANCDGLLGEGAPLQEYVSIVDAGERYVLRGFDLFGITCAGNYSIPVWFVNVYSYLDWMLYNMRYNEAVNEDEQELIANATLERWRERQQAVGSEKLKLFNMESCGQDVYNGTLNVHNIALIELVEPVNVNERLISPICMPLIEELRNSTSLELLVPPSFFIHQSTQLQPLDLLNCQERFTQLSANITLNSRSRCAVALATDAAEPAALYAGTPLQTLLRVGSEKRYFLSGINSFMHLVNYINPTAPYLFTDTNAYLDWILENMQLNGSVPTETSSNVKRVDPPPTQNISRRRLFNFKTCGAYTKGSSANATYETEPWHGFVHNWDPVFNSTSFIQCSVVLLATPADISQPNVQPICLPILEEVRSYAVSSLAMVTMGLEDFTLLTSKINGTQFVPSTECQRRWDGMALNIQIEQTKQCILVVRDPRNECYPALPGFPLHTTQQLLGEQRHFLRGLFSLRPELCSSYYPAIYTDVDVYLDWILDNMDERLAISRLPYNLTQHLIFSEK